MADNMFGDVPLELQPEMQNISQQQKLSQMLLQQAQQQPQGQMISGHYVAPALTQYLQPLFSAYAGSKGMENADQKQLELAKAIRQVGGEEVKNILETYKTDPNAALQLAASAQTPQAKALATQLSKSVLLEPTPEERQYKAAIADGSFKGGFNAFKNQMTDAQRESNRIERARLGIAQREQAFNLGLPMSSGGGGMPTNQPSMQTINPGSPILAPGQQMPQQGMPQAGVPTFQPGQMPRFNSKAEQELWLSTQKDKAKLQVDAQNALPGALNTVNSGLKAINGMIGDTTVDANGNLVYGKTPPHKGFNDAVGFPSAASGFGISSFIKGSDWKNFEARFKEIEGKSFLSAIDSLRGTGSISEVEGAKATSAINRMSLSQSPAEFVEAANELKTVMAKGYAAAQQRAGAAPINYNAQPSAGGVQPKLRYNLQTGQWE